LCELIQCAFVLGMGLSGHSVGIQAHTGAIQALHWIAIVPWHCGTGALWHW